MFSSEVNPVFRGASYVDDAQLVSHWDGTPLPFDPADILTWRLHRLAPSFRGFGGGYGYGLGWDYGSEFHPSPVADRCAVITLTIGQQLVTDASGAVQWFLHEGQTAALCDPEYRMTLDLTRSGETTCLLDTILTVTD